MQAVPVVIMGNSSTRSGKLRIDEKQIAGLFSDCLKKVFDLDESMMRFLEAFDTMKATLRMVTDYQSTTTKDDKLTLSETEKKTDSDRRQLIEDVLVRLEEPVSREKSAMLQKLLELLRFIMTTAKTHSTLKVGDLGLDNYKEELSFETSFVYGVRQILENEIKDLKENQKKLKQRLEILERRESNFVKEKKEIQKENKALNELNENKDEENEKLKNSLRTLEQEKDALKNKFHEEMKAEKEILLESTQQKDDQIESLHNEINELNKSIDTLNDNSDKERRAAEDLRSEYEKIKEELENMKSKRVLNVQLFYHRKGGLITEVVENLKEVLKTHIEDGKTELKFISCNSSSQLNPGLPTLLIAICASRLGTDAANAIQGLEINRNIVLLVFHHKDVHALPSQASERVLTGQEFKRLGGIYDMAFLSQRGIYSCEMNEKSITTVLNFLNSM